TLLLMVPSILLASLIGVLLGVSAARRVSSPWDYAIGTLSMIGYSTPPFWLGILLIIVFASTLRWLPTQGMMTLGTSAPRLAQALDVGLHILLPTSFLTSWHLAASAPLTR